ncbi:MAG: hypothetical protein FWC09_10635, partial [Lachnospiraceae bacterium]|nr:hypothetical protein [Lachnospiraceae bacterium]
MSNQITSLLAEIERIYESRESIFSINADKLSQDEQKITQLLQNMMNDYQASLEYDYLKYKLAAEGLGIGIWFMDIQNGEFSNPNNIFTIMDECRTILGFTDKSELPDDIETFSNRLHPDEKGWILAACEAHVNDHTG